MKKNIVKPLSIAVMSMMLLACKEENKKFTQEPTTEKERQRAKALVVGPVDPALTNVKLLEVKSMTRGSMTASWLPAKDDDTPAEQLTYTIHASMDKNFIPSSKTLIFYKKNVTSAHISSSLYRGAIYYVRLIVLDKNNNSKTSNLLAVRAATHDFVMDDKANNEEDLVGDMVISKNLTKGKAFNYRFIGEDLIKVAFIKIHFSDTGNTNTLPNDFGKHFSYTTDADELTLTTTYFDANNEQLSEQQTVLTFNESNINQNTNSKLPSTGITKCGDYSYDAIGQEISGRTHNNNLDCALTVDSEGDPIPAKQDGHVQAGAYMSYTKLKRNGAECVKDNVTGLVWEQKTDDGGLHDKDNTYSWYNPDSKTNGGDVGGQNGGVCKGSNCDTQSYIQALNSANYCGYSNWRLPTLPELISIVDYGTYKPAINGIFSNTRSRAYWSSSPLAVESMRSHSVFGIDFTYGNIKHMLKYYSYDSVEFARDVRAVRSE